MKLNSFFMLALSVLLCACDDNLTNIGSSIRPDSDDLIVKSAIFDIKSSTFLADSIYIKTPNPLLGEIHDNIYGTIRADYAAQFYAQEGFNFNAYKDGEPIFELGKDSLLNNRLDSAVLRIMYKAYIGDSLTPMAVTAYELTKSLPTDNSAFYSNYMASDEFINDYITPLQEIGSAAYTGKDLSISDSIKKLEGYVPYVDMTLNDEIAERFLNEVENNPSTFNNLESFLNFFPGVYLKNTFGNGTILQVSSTAIAFFYRTYYKTKTDAGADTAYVKPLQKTIYVSPDVVQLNSVANPIEAGGNPEIMNNDSATFVTTPGGYFTEVKLPVGSIIETLEADSKATAQYLNGVNLNMLAYPPTNIFYQTPPSYMLLIERSKMNEFFEKNEVPDSKTSFLASLSSDSTSANYGYNFGNINSMILALADEIKSKKQAELTETDTAYMALVPVSVTIDQNYNIIKRTANYFLPGGISLKGGKNIQKSTMIYTVKINDTNK